MSTAMQAKKTIHEESMNLDEMLVRKQRIFIRNKMVGVLAITVYEQNGRATRVNVPKTKHPFCLSDAATPYAIENSTNIRQMIANGNIVILDPKKALEELNKPGVREELSAAIRRIGHLHDGVTALRKSREAGIKEDDEVNQADEMSKLASKVLPAEEAAKAAAAFSNNPHAEIGDAPPADAMDEQGNPINEDDENEDTANVTPRIIAICGLLAEKDMKPKEAKIELDNMIEELDTDDLEYIIQHTSGLVREWAMAALAAKRGNQIPAELNEEPDNK